MFDRNEETIALLVRSQPSNEAAANAIKKNYRSEFELPRLFSKFNTQVTPESEVFTKFLISLLGNKEIINHFDLKAFAKISMFSKKANRLCRTNFDIKDALLFASHKHLTNACLLKLESRRTKIKNEIRLHERGLDRMNKKAFDTNINKLIAAISILLIIVLEAAAIGLLASDQLPFPFMPYSNQTEYSKVVANRATGISYCLFPIVVSIALGCLSKVAVRPIGTLMHTSHISSLKNQLRCITLCRDTISYLPKSPEMLDEMYQAYKGLDAGRSLKLPSFRKNTV